MEEAERTVKHEATFTIKSNNEFNTAAAHSGDTGAVHFSAEHTDDAKVAPIICRGKFKLFREHAAPVAPNTLVWQFLAQ